MRQIPQQTPPFVDGEGFPQGTDVRPADKRDKENGELLCQKVICVRKPPEFRVSPRIQSFLSSTFPHRSLGNGQRFSSFRIQQFTRDVCGGRPKSLEGPQLQTCVYLKGGTPVHFTKRPLDPYGPTLGMVRRDDFSVREAFRVPKESLPKSTDEQPAINPNTVCISIWEEFIFGKSVLSTRHETSAGTKHMKDEKEEGVVKSFHATLSSFLPKLVVDFLTYFVYFLVFFFSCVGYNMFCELLCYILFAQHLKIHEKANQEKMDIAFTGSIFQGPLYAITRNYCEHCNERERAKVIMKLMSKMKADILPPRNKDDSPVKDTTQDPSG